MLDHITQFLYDYPLMSHSPFYGECELLTGLFKFNASISGRNALIYQYRLNILVPKNYPKALPIIKEIEGKIPRIDDLHINDDGSFCLGSPLRLLSIANEKATLSHYAEKCLIPYLYAVTNKLMVGGKLYFGELRHGIDGIYDDYYELLEVNTRKQVNDIIAILSTSEKKSLDSTCPCGCGKLLKQCNFKNKIKKIRNLATTEWFRNIALNSSAKQ